MKLCDLHLHSNNSFDAQSSVEQMCKSAVQKGLSYAAITDHCEAPVIGNKDFEYGDFDVLIPKSIEEASRTKEKFADKITLLRGVELGEPMHNPELTQRALSYGEYDFILASVHNLRNMPDFYYIDYNKADVDGLLNMYFDELIETAAFEGYDSLAHLTYPLRYIKERTGFLPDLAPFGDKLDTIFKILIENNKALEINVQGFSKGFDMTLPDEAQIRRFKELGGKYITVGSDAHCAENVGVGVEKGLKLAKKCGFDYYTVFENRKPVLIEINE